MMVYHGGQVVNKGYYLNHSTWEFESVTGGGALCQGAPASGDSSGTFDRIGLRDFLADSVLSHLWLLTCSPRGIGAEGRNTLVSSPINKHHHCRVAIGHSTEQHCSRHFRYCTPDSSTMWTEGTGIVSGILGEIMMSK